MIFVSSTFDYDYFVPPLFICYVHKSNCALIYVSQARFQTKKINLKDKKYAGWMWCAGRILLTPGLNMHFFIIS